MDVTEAAPPTTGIPTQRVGGLVEIPGLLRELGADPAQVLASAGLDAQALGHIDQRLPVDATDRLLAACVQQTGCPHFGLLAGQRWNLAHQGVIADLMHCAPTVGDALHSFTLVQHGNSDMGVAFVLEEEDTAALGFALYRTDLRRPEQIYDAAMGVAAGIMRGLCRLHWTPAEVLLSRPHPQDVAPYKACFGPRVKFDQVYSAVRFAKRWLIQPTPAADPRRHRALLQSIEANTGVDLVPRLRRALRVLLIQGHSSGDTLARYSSLGRRTLNRRLQAQGTTFQKLLDEVRLDVARELLAHTHTPLNQIAAALCYADLSAFMHAFRRWTGTTPAQFRQQATLQAGAHEDADKG